MPYNEQDKSVGLYVFLPSESSNIAEFVEHLSVEVFDEVANYGTESEITIELPKMAFSQRYQFTDVSIFSQLSLKKNLLQSRAGFS